MTQIANAEISSSLEMHIDITPTNDLVARWVHVSAYRDDIMSLYVPSTAWDHPGYYYGISNGFTTDSHQSYTERTRRRYLLGMRDVYMTDTSTVCPNILSFLKNGGCYALV